MDTQLDRHCNDVLHATSVKDLLRKMVAFAEDRDFWSVSASVITDHSASLREHQYVTNAPAGYLPQFEDLEAANFDPVARHASKRSTPLVWDRSTYREGGQAGLWEQQESWGYRSGIVVAFHLPRGRHFMFGPDNDRPTCGSPAQVRQLVEDVVQFAAHAQAAACELCLHLDPPEHGQPSPTPSELEALRWSMDGMTRWEVGAKMGLSECDIALRLQRVMGKLGCSTKYEAVLRAIKLGLIECA